MEQKLIEIASRFNTDRPIVAAKPLGEGFINDTFIASTEGGVRYILQRKNNRIFTDIPAMMDNIRRVTDHLKKRVTAMGGDPLRQVMTLVETGDGKLYHV
ncbi:MAG: aminoglycoside phosphotransferase family protein, partial [Rikenellaceae bacterium]|nr:aminoglycoside phosphotransferase family protein [Rikenellaceae bacterium]